MDAAPQTPAGMAGRLRTRALAEVDLETGRTTPSLVHVVAESVRTPLSKYYTLKGKFPLVEPDLVLGVGWTGG
jgi:hypothetical protein